MHCPKCQSPRAFVYGYRPQTGSALVLACQCLTCGHGWPYHTASMPIDASET